MTIGIIFGGSSYEHEISIISAITLNGILKYEAKYIFIDTNNDFYFIKNKDLQANYFSSGKYKNSKKLSLEKQGFSYKTLFNKTVIKYDCIINLIHGAYGEDGTLSALLENMEQFYISPRIDACVVSYNKYITKMYANTINVKSLDYQIIIKNENKISTKIKYPVIIKPCRGGSSMGVNIAKDDTQFNYYIQEAFDYDDEIMIEPFIANVKEYNLAGYYATDMVYSNVEEPEKGDILDFDKKYMDFSRDAKINCANISKELETKLQQAFLKIYANIFKGSIIRCDFFVINNDVYLNEINPVPGSMAHYLFDDFNTVIENMFYALPKKRKISTQYNYIHNINKAKG